MRHANRAQEPAVNFLAYGVAGWIFVIGVYGAIVSRNLIHLALCLSVSQSSTYVLLLTVGYRHGAGAPIFKGVPLGTKAVDPVVQAMTLTDVVVSATVTALLLALAVQTQKRFGSVDPDELGALRG
jgi:multicomponent Na+:H+ antiporter subunit C